MVMGRPKIDFEEKDWKIINTACQFKMELEDVAGLVGCGATTLVTRIKEEFNLTFREYRSIIMAETKQTIFSKQLEVAKEGNTTMLIWLGKNICNQTDKVENTVDTKDMRLKWTKD